MDKKAIHFLIIGIPCLILAMIPVIGWIAAPFLFMFLAKTTGLFND